RGQRGMRGGQRGGPPGVAGRRARDYRVFSPDRKAYVFIRNHNLYLVETNDKPFDSLMLPTMQTDLAGILGQLWGMTKGSSWNREAKAIQLNTDGGEDYSFSTMGTFGAG